MFEIGKLVARISIEGADTASRQLAGLKAEWRGMSQGAQEAARTIGGPMLIAGGSLIAMLGLAVNAAMKWESAWAGVTKTVDGTPKQLAAVEAGLRGVSRVLPATHEEIAAVAEAAGQLGVKTPNVVAFTRTMVDLGETTNLSADQAATALARFMNIMGTSQGEVRNLGSAVVDLGNNYATTEAEIVEMAQRLAGAGVQVGLSEGQVLGLATALSSVGIEAEAGGSAMSRVMIEIASAVDKGGDQMEKFAEVSGLSAEEFATKWRTKPGEALALFVKGLANAESKGKTTLGVLEELGITEIRMRDALLRSAAASDQFTEAMDRGNTAFEEGNALQDEAAKRYATVESQIQMTANAINDAAIDFGQVFMPAIAAAAGAVRDFAAFMGDLPPELQGAVGVFTLLTGAVLLFGGTLLITIPKIAQFRIATQILALELPRTGAALKGVASILTGPWGVAFAAALAGVLLLQDGINKMKTSTAEWSNVIANARSIDDLFNAEDAGRLIDRFDAAGASAETLREKLDIVANNPFLAGLDSEAAEFRATLKTLGEQLATTAESDLPAAQESFRMMSEEMGLNHEQQLDLLEVMEPYREALVKQADAMGVNVTTGTDLQNSEALLKLAFGESEESSLSAAEAYIETADQVNALSDQLDTLIEKLMEANGQNIDAVDANANYQASLADVSKEIDRQREAFVAAHGSADGFTVSLDENTEAGAQNASMLAGVAEDAQDAALAQFEVDKKTMGASKATDVYIGRLQTSRQNLINAAHAAGFNKDQVQALIDKVYRMPTAREIDIIANTASASRRISEFMYSWNGRTIAVNVNAKINHNYAEGGYAFADGGTVEYNAWGRMRESHMAQIAAAGAMRVWAEPETGGEAYIPLGSSKRGRSTEILDQVASMFGYDLVSRARAGGAAPTSTTAKVGPHGASARTNEPITVIVQINGREIARAVRDYERSIS